MRGSKIVTTAILVLMLTAVMGLRDVEAQTPLACENTPFTTGMVVNAGNSRSDINNIKLCI